MKKTSDALEIMRRSVPPKDWKRAEQMIARAAKKSRADQLGASIKAIQKKNRDLSADEAQALADEGVDEVRRARRLNQTKGKTK